MGLVLLVLTATSPPIGAHPFYVSVTEMHYRPQKEALQISIKTFSDDLERALDGQGLPGHLFATDEAPDSLQLGLVHYLRERFQVFVNGREASWSYLGHEAGLDATWHYLLIEQCPRPERLRVCSRIFTDLFDTQRNIVRFHWEDGPGESMLLGRNNACKTIDVAS